MPKIEHMSVAEVKRRFADVIGRVLHAGARIIVERRGRPVVAIVPVEDVLPGAAGSLGDVLGQGGEEGEKFAQFMAGVVSERRNRPVPEVGG